MSAEQPTPAAPVTLARAAKLFRAGRVDEADALCTQLLAATPDDPPTVHLKGVIALRRGRADEAVTALEAARRGKPDSFAILSDLGSALNAARRFEEAAEVLERALKQRPDSENVLLTLGVAQLELQRVDDALASFSRAHAINSLGNIAAHMVTAITEGRSGGATSSYVPRLFNSYAEGFEKHLRELGYRVPEMMRDVLVRRAHMPVGDALDIGCGTGLVGDALHGLAEAIDGIDVAEKMIAAAQAKGIYRRLLMGDAADLLANASPPLGPYDVVTAADVFIYVGKLEELFTRVVACMRSGGLFVFSTELSQTDDVLVRASGRFAHADAYIMQLATENAFKMSEAQETTIRVEEGVPIPGRLYALRKD